MRALVKPDVLISVCLAFSCVQKKIDADSSTSVFGGKVVESTDVRFAAVYSLGNTSGGCTGTFVTPTRMITAAHCIENKTDGGLLTINPRVSELPMASVPIDVFGMIQMQKVFGTADGFKDVAVLKFRTAQNVKVMPLCASNPQIGQKAYIVGFGLDERGITGVKRVGDVEVSAIVKDQGTLYVESTKVSALPGDSGGPLVSVEGNCIIGIASNLQMFQDGKMRATYVDLRAAKSQLRSYLSEHLGAGVFDEVSGADANTNSGAEAAQSRIIQSCRPDYTIAQRPDGSRFVLRKSDRKTQSISEESQRVGQTKSFEVVWEGNPNGLGGAVLFPKDGSASINCDPIR